MRKTGHLIWVGWMVLLIGAAWLLPPLDSRIRPHPASAALIVVCCAGMIAWTCVSLYRYFSRAWRNRRRVPNRTEYVVWLGLETLAAVGVVIAVLYGYSRL